VTQGKHGSYTKWKYGKCPCGICREAKAEAIKAKPPKPVLTKRVVDNTTFDPEWREKAECRRLGPLDWKVEDGKTRHMTAEEWGKFIDRLFFPRRGDSVEAAVNICSRCPVSKECLAAGLVNMPFTWGPPVGIWGGKGHGERQRLFGWGRVKA